MTRINGGELQDVRLFAGLSAQELDVIAGSGVVHMLPANSVFIRQGESSSSLYVVLSGRVKVYSMDTHGGEQVLCLRGPGDHLGEIALLGDSVRTASAATLVDSRLLVLPRRPFVQCLARNPQIGLNLNEAFILRTMSSAVGDDATVRYRAWSAFRRSGMPLILLIGGCAGTGKSTVAAELSLRLDIGRTQSTDILREVMRLLITEQADPALHASTYEAWQGVRDVGGGDSGKDRPLVEGFLAQADRLAPAIDGVISRSVKEQASTIIEGIHLHPAYHERLETTDAAVLPVLLAVPSRDDLKTNFARRGEQAPSRGSRRYLDNLEEIWRLQDYFVGEARRCGVAVVQNRHLSGTVDRIMEEITDFLVGRFVREGER